MRLEVIIRTIAKYSELTEDQKLKVLENLDLSDHFEFQKDSVLEYFETSLKLLGFSGLDFQYSGFWSQGDGASFTGSFEIPKTVKELNQRVRNLRKECPKFQVFDFKSLRFSKEYKEDGAVKVYRINYHYSHSGTITSDHEGLKEFARSISNALYKALEMEYDYLSTRKYKEDCISANEWEFYTDTFKIA